MTDTTDWLLLSLAPVAPERVDGWFDGIPGLKVTFPVARTRAAVSGGDRDGRHRPDNVRRAVAREAVRSVVNGLGPVITRRSADR